MKKFGFAIVAALSFSTVGLTGCGSRSTKVIEAPAEEDTGEAIEGASEDEYNAAMEKSMSQQGN